MEKLSDIGNAKNTVIYYYKYNVECNIFNYKLKESCKKNDIICAVLIEEKRSVDNSINMLHTLCKNERKVIITTQSPFIIGNFLCDSDNILLKYKDGKIYDSDSAYGLDYNTILEDFFDVSPRDSTINTLINGYLRLYGKRNYSGALSCLHSLKEYIGIGTNEELPDRIQKELNLRIKEYD